MQLFYAHIILDQNAYLDKEETKHCIKTLRKKVGDMLMVTDGRGGLYETTLVEITKQGSQLQITKTLETADQRSFHLHLAIAPTKNIGRLEWFLEKTTELGVDAITFLQCDRSERKTIRLDRLQKVVLAAAKQSLKTTFPVLHPLTKFGTFVENTAASFKGIAHCQRSPLPHLKTTTTAADQVLLLIGPEGDFSPREVEQALQQGFVEVGLGNSRLRTETAGIIACHTIHLMHT